MNRKRLATLILGIAMTGGLAIGGNGLIANKHVNNNLLLTNNISNNNNKKAVVVGNSSLVLRQTARSNGKVSSYISVGEMLTINSTKGNYYNVTVQETGATGYISMNNAQIIKSGVNSPFEQLNEGANVINVSSVVNLRTAPDMANNVIAKLTNGTNITVMGKQGQWYKVNDNGTIGFIYEEYVGITDGSSTVVNPGVNSGTNPGTNSGTNPGTNPETNP
ncbi:MAG: SH3 domain-containing protein, partial [Sarcina sp.]